MFLVMCDDVCVHFLIPLSISHRKMDVRTFNTIAHCKSALEQDSSGGGQCPWAGSLESSSQEVMSVMV